VPTTVAHLLSKYRPKAVIDALKTHDTAPGINPMDANAEGKASAPAPMTVLVRLTTEDFTDA
jgi:hypothetical protein